MRSLVYYVAVGVDGLIAGPDGDTSAFPVEPATLAALFERYPETCPAHAREALGVSAAPRRFDTVLMGYRTHAPALAAGLTSAYPHLRQIVVTHRAVPADPTVETWSGDIAARVADLKREPGGDIWLCGGADLASRLVDVIDEIQLKINPVALGRGLPLLAADEPLALELVDHERLPGGVLLVTYRPRRSIAARSHPIAAGSHSAAAPEAARSAPPGDAEDTGG